MLLEILSSWSAAVMSPVENTKNMTLFFLPWVLSFQKTCECFKTPFKSLPYYSCCFNHPFHTFSMPSSHDIVKVINFFVAPHKISIILKFDTGLIILPTQTIKEKSTYALFDPPKQGNLNILVIYTRKFHSPARYNEVSPPRMCAGATSLWYKATTVLSKPTAQPEIKRPKHIQAIDIAPGREITSPGLYR